MDVEGHRQELEKNRLKEWLVNDYKNGLMEQYWGMTFVLKLSNCNNTEDIIIPVGTQSDYEMHFNKRDKF